VSKLIRTDFHVHTHHSLCGHREATPEAVVRAAREAGLEAVGIADHLVAPSNFDRPRLVREQLPAHLDGIRVYVGGEAEMHARDHPSISPDFAAALDFVVFSASHLHNIGDHALRGLDLPDMLSFMLDLMWGVVETGYTDILAHPFHAPMCRFTFGDLVRAVGVARLRPLAQAAAEAGVAIECNPRFVRAEPDAAAWLFRQFLDAGCKLAINSDAHHPAHVGCRGDQFAAEDELRAIGITEESVWRLRGGGE
jgi:histidinol phosphatase-like PHP family hydrolase